MTIHFHIPGQPVVERQAVKRDERTQDLFAGVAA